MESKCPLVTKPTHETNEKQELCRSILKKMEPSQKAIYDNFAGETILCPVDRAYPEGTAGRVGSHEMCLKRFVINAYKPREVVTLEEEIERMYRSTRLQKGPAGVSLWMEAFSESCSVQADRILKAIEALEKNGWLEKDDHLHISLIAHDCDKAIGGLLEEAKAELKTVKT